MALATNGSLISEPMKETRQHDAIAHQPGTQNGSDDAHGGGIWPCIKEWVDLPPAAWSRIAVMFTTLAFIKLVLLIGLRKHLHQIHWRLSAQSTSWIDHLAFYAVIVMGVYTLVELGRQCHGAGVRTVRRLNLIVLSLALPLIFFTLHEGDKNYLYPILTGVLPWSSLVPYLSMDCFFRPPFLATWMVVYAASYYVMARQGRERWALGLTGVFGGSYWAVCLQELTERREDLWVAAVFGLLALLLLKRRDQEFSPAWWFVPTAWTLLVWGLFRTQEQALATLGLCFEIVVGWATASIVVATWVARRDGVFQPWGKVMAFYFLTCLLFANSNYPMGPSYNNLLGFYARFPHYFIGELVVAGFVAVLAVL